MADIEYKINRLTESLMDDYGKGRPGLLPKQKLPHLHRAQ